MITDDICALLDAEIGPMQEAIGFNYEVGLTPVQVSPTELAIAAQFIFSAKSTIIGQLLWHISQPLPVEVVLNMSNLRQMLLEITELFNQQRSHLANTPPPSRV